MTTTAAAATWLGNPDLLAVPAHPSKAIAEAVAGRSDVIDLSVGVPGFGTPPALREALARRLLDAPGDREVFDTYAASRGVPRAREAVARLYRRDHGLAVDTDAVVITHGAAEALWLAVFSLTAPGDDVLLSDVAYPLYSAVVSSLGRTLVRVPTGRGFEVTAPDAVRAVTPRTSMLVLNSPANPTGATIPPDELEAVLAAMSRRGVVVVHDEVLGPFTSSVRHVPAIACPSGGTAVVVNSISKPLGATGWRFGWAVGPRPAVDLMAKAHTYLTLAVNTAMQEAVADVLATDEIAELVRRRVERVASGRRALHAALGALDGFDVPGHDPGGFYLFPSVARLADGLSGDDPGAAVARHLLDRCGVAVVPGAGFGPKARSHVRMAAVADEATLLEAADRLRSA